MLKWLFPCHKSCAVWKESLNLIIWLLHSQESGLKVNQPASFAIRLNGAKGKIDAKVHSPSGAVEECHVSELEPGEHSLMMFKTISWPPEHLLPHREFSSFDLRIVRPRDEHVAWKMTSWCQELFTQGYVPCFSMNWLSPKLCKIEVFKSWIASEGIVTLIINEIRCGCWI